MSFTAGTRVTAGNPAKANAEMDVLIANADNLTTRTDFFGARILKVNQSLATATTAQISFTAEYYDLGGWWAVSPNPTRLTVPSGIIWAQITVDLVMAQDMEGTGLAEWTNAQVNLIKNGSTFHGAPFLYVDKVDSYSMTTSIISVVATDYFEVNMIHGTGTTKPISCVASIRGWQ